MTFPVRPPAPGDFVWQAEYRQTSATSCINCSKDQLECDKAQPCSNCTKIFANCLYSELEMNTSVEASGTWQTGPNSFRFQIEKPEARSSTSSSPTLAKKNISCRAVNCDRCIKAHLKCNKAQPCSNCVKVRAYCVLPNQQRGARATKGQPPQPTPSQSDHLPPLFASEKESGILFEKRENE